MIKIIKPAVFFLFAILGFFSVSLLAEEAKLNPSHPEKYYVKDGDTLWDISRIFLQNPWAWPEIWHLNEQVSNPHLIYPGDEISLVYIKREPSTSTSTSTSRTGATASTVSEMKPALMVTKRDPGINVVKLSPQARTHQISSTIPTIPLSKVASFLNSTRVVDKDALQKTPYVLAADQGRLIMGVGDTMYARGDWSTPEGTYAIYRAGEAYTDPDTKEVLGYEARDLGFASFVTANEDVATLKITRSDIEIREYDRLLPIEGRDVEASFYPKTPDESIKGQIIRVFSGVKNIGQYDVVVINRGEREGVEIGDVFAIYRRGMIVRDKNQKQQKVQLPDERAGLMMVFRTFDKVSLALVLNAKSVLSVGDKIERP